MGSGYGRNRIRLVAVLVTCLLFSTVFYGCGGGGGGGAVVATPQYGSIEGYVYAPVGSGARVAEAVPAGKKPVEGANVSVSCGTTNKNSTTNSSGYFKITSLPTGSCSLTVTYSGFGSYQTTTTVKANSTSLIGGSSGISLSPTTSGSITVTANYSDGIVLIDGESTGVTIPTGLSHKFDEIVPGNHRIGFHQTNTDVTLEQIVSLPHDGSIEVSFTTNPIGNHAPIVDAGSDIICSIGIRYDRYYNGDFNEFTPVPKECLLDGSGSSDSDNDNLKYLWEQISGTNISLDDETASSTTFIPTDEDQLVFQLTVNDGYLSSTEEVSVKLVHIDGKFVDSVSYEQDFFGDNIWTYNADGSNLTNLTNNTEYGIFYNTPRWSPDGKSIIFDRDDFDANLRESYIMNSDGSNMRSISDETGGGFWADYSPDGKLIAYIAKDGDNGNNAEIYLVNSDLTNRRKLTNTGSVWLSWPPVFSADSSKLLVAALVEYDNYDIYLVDVDDGSFINLTNDDEIQFHLSWTNDGRILFNQLETFSSVQKTYIMNADGTGKELFEPLSDGGWPLMNNDGKYIFYRGTGTGNAGISALEFESNTIFHLMDVDMNSSSAAGKDYDFDYYYSP